MIDGFKKMFVVVAVSLLGLLGVSGGTSTSTSQYGAAGVAGEYATQIAQAITSSDTSITAVSRTLFTGETFTDADLFHPINLAIGKGTTREYDACAFFNTTSTFPTFTGCLRGVSALATSTSIYLVPGAAYAHTAGESLSMTNQPAYFRNMVDTHTNQNVAGVKTFTNGQVNIGSTTTELVVTGGKAGWSDDGGATTFTFASGSSGLTASTTRGIVISASQIALNASTTAGLNFDSNGSLYVNASSTTSTNGGFLSFNTFGQIYFDVVNFLKGAWTWLGPQTFNATSTFVGTTIVPFPTTPTSAVPRSYVDNMAYGDGSDGAFNIQSATTTWNTAGKTVYQYSSFTIGGTGALTFGSNNQNKAVIVFVQGDLTVTSTASSAVDLSGFGGLGGAGGTAGAGGSSGSFGANVAVSNSGIAGTQGSGGTNCGGTGGGGAGGINSNGTASTIGATCTAPGSPSAIGTSVAYSSSGSIQRHLTLAYIGAGGAGGGSGTTVITGDGGAGGNGGGAIEFIVGGNINITSNFKSVGLNGANGSAGASSGGGGAGGGSGGGFGIYYNGSVTANSATFTLNGGTGGTGGAGSATGGNGGNGGSGISEIRKIQGKFDVIY